MNQAARRWALNGGLFVASAALGCGLPAPSSPLAPPTIKQGGLTGRQPAGNPPADDDDVDDLIKKLKDEGPDHAKDSEGKAMPPRTEQASRPVQQPPSDAPAPDAPRPRATTEYRLLKYFDQLDLTDEQKEKMAQVAKPYDDKIAQLKRLLNLAKGRIGATGLVLGYVKAIRKLEKQRGEALERILTDEQRDKLNKLRSDR